jgi:hypothetical protein
MLRQSQRRRPRSLRARHARRPSDQQAQEEEVLDPVSLASVVRSGWVGSWQ